MSVSPFRLPDEVLAVIEKALKKGRTVELKKVNGKVEVIEIDRQLKIKTTM